MPRTKQMAKRPKFDARKAELQQNLDATREKLTEINVPWVKNFSLVSEEANGKDALLFISESSSKMFASYEKRVLCMVKGIALHELCIVNEFQAVYDVCTQYGLHLFWQFNLKHLVAPREVKMFYANMYGVFRYRRCPLQLSSYVNEVSVSWNVEQVNEWIGFENDGVDVFLTNPWNKDVLGVTLQEVKKVVGNDLVTMPLKHRLLLLLVTYCICGKSAKLPSNLDYYLVYLMLLGKKINFGALYLHVMVESMFIKNKGLCCANLITTFLQHSGVNFEEEPIRHYDFVGKTNIDMIIASRKSRGKKPMGEEEEMEVEENVGGNVGEEGGASRKAQSDSDDREESLRDRIEQLEQEAQVKYDIMLEENAARITEIEELKEKNKMQDKRVAKMEKKMSKWKTFLASLNPQACFPSSSSDSD